MSSEEIANEIGSLVDHLRASRNQKISLVDVAAATEVLLQATRMYFKNIDDSVFTEMRQMSDLILEMRSDVASLRPEDLKDDKIPRAGLELDAVVKNTEDATNTIMEAAEEIMALDLTDADDAGTAINNACMRIFEACSFQDITGQRVNKVVKTLTQIESRLESIRSDWANDLGPQKEVPEPEEEANILLGGPALEGEGVDQSGVDALLSGEVNGGTQEADAAKPAAPEPKAKPKPKAEPEVAEKAKPKPKIEPEVAKKVETKPAKKPEAEKPPAPVADGDGDNESADASQSDIDALFD